MFYELAEKAQALERSGRKIVRLNVGDTNIPVPKCATEAAVKCLNKGIMGYLPSAGMMELRQAIALRENCEVENVVVGPGSKHLIYALLSVLAKKGNKVVFPSPYWPAYPLACKQLGLKAREIPTTLPENWQLGKNFEEGDLTIICNPLNPTSTIYGRKSVEAIINDANAKGGHIIIDEAYRGLAFSEIPPYEGAIRVRSFSKEFCMENWRLGYMVAPEKIIRKVVQFNHITTTCVPPFVQQAGIACIENEREILAENIRIWKKRLSCAQKALQINGFRFATPQAGIYVFATHDGIADSGKYAMSLLEKGVAVSPGESFGNYPKFVRICSNREASELEMAIDKMGQEAAMP